MEGSYESLISNETWELVELPVGCAPIGCKWVFKIKYTSDGRVKRFKCCLVAKEYAQKYGIDYEETFSPVVRFSSIRTLRAFAVQHNMLIRTSNGHSGSVLKWKPTRRHIHELAGAEHLFCKLKNHCMG